MGDGEEEKRGRNLDNFHFIFIFIGFRRQATQVQANRFGERVFQKVPPSRKLSVTRKKLEGGRREETETHEAGRTLTSGLTVTVT